MSDTNATLQNAKPGGAILGVVPDLPAAVLLGRPTARRLRFGDVDRLKRVKGVLTAPSAWLKPDGPAPTKTRKRTVDVLLPQDQLLKRAVKLPKTPRRVLAKAVSLDMVRRTPFKPGETYTVLSDVHTSAEGTTASHWIARRDDVDALRARLAGAGIRVRRILIEDGPKEPLADFSAQIYPAGKLWRGVNLLAVLVALAAGGWIWAQPALVAQEARIAQETELQSLTAQALQLRRTIEAQGSSESERSAFLARMTRRTPMATTLRAATVVLPDYVWLTDMAIDRNRVVVRGSTAGSAAQMLLDLPDNRLLRNPQLAGPVSQTNDGRERFEIVFQTPFGSAR
ncbi:MAG: PilN domain-containing protein [Pseudomonadota bacterium]